MKDDGLYMGVNLLQMELDRDRRAVVRRNDIEQQVSKIWTTAILQRKDLLPIFFDLLLEDHQVNLIFYLI